MESAQPISGLKLSRNIALCFIVQRFTHRGIAAADKTETKVW